MLSRRAFLLSSAAGVTAAIALGPLRISVAQDDAEVFEVAFSDDEWREILSPSLTLGRWNATSFSVLRQEDTEPAFSHPFDKLYDAGQYHCRGCDLFVYSSEHKYDSRTGWPSFWQAQENAVRTKTDYLIGSPRTEVHCRRCGGHFGHIFNDGPAPTGERHCLNGLALRFYAA